jgi:hypothetical protein
VGRNSQLPHETIAWPERELPPGGTIKDYLAARKEGARTFVLWRKRDRSEVFARVVTLWASQRKGAEYEVRDSHGEPLGVIRCDRQSLSTLRRARWSVRQFDQPDRPPAAGAKGKIAWWCIWLPLYPLQILLLIITLGSYNGVESPRRTRLRSTGEVVLDYHGVNRNLEVLADWWDQRVIAALLVLLESRDSGLSERTKSSYV